MRCKILINYIIKLFLCKYHRYKSFFHEFMYDNNSYKKLKILKNVNIAIIAIRMGKKF